MEDQATYNTQPNSWKRWHLKQLQPITTVTEDAVKNAYLVAANDSVHAPITPEEMNLRLINDTEVHHAGNLGYFLGQTFGPKGYYGIFIAKTPYSMPLMILELDHDPLMKEEVTEGGEG